MERDGTQIHMTTAAVGAITIAVIGAMIAAGIAAIRTAAGLTTVVITTAITAASYLKSVPDTSA